MKTIVIIILILLAIYGINKAVDCFIDYLHEKYAKEKHFCRRCHNAFILTKKYRGLTHCIECGRELTPFAVPEYVQEIKQPVFEEFEDKEKNG